VREIALMVDRYAGGRRVRVDAPANDSIESDNGFMPANDSSESAAASGSLIWDTLREQVS